MNPSAPLRTTFAMLARAASDPTSRGSGIEDDDGRISYAELVERVERAAAMLAGAGLGRGDRIALRLPTSIAFAEAFFAVLACGAAALPLGSGAPPAETRRLIEDAAARALITTDGAAVPELDAVPRFVADGGGFRALRGDASAAPRPPRAGDPALVAQSFATTGRPQLVVRTHENLWWDADGFRGAARLDADDVVLGVVPLSHAHGLCNALLASVHAGARLVLRARFFRRPTLDLLERERVTVFPTVPFVVRMLARTEPGRRWNLDALRVACSAGAPLDPGAQAAFRARFAVPVRQLYGLTAAGNVTYQGDDAAAVDPATVGTPLPGVEVTIADGADTPPATGEVVVRSRAAAGGPERPLRTFDLGRWSAGGELVLTGRLSTFINAAGNKVDPAEVEAALRRHPAVADAAVYALPAAHGEQVVAAAVVPRSPCTADDLRLHCRALLASFKVPRVVRVRPALPRSPLGNVLIDQLIMET
jgi:long-chain acyl-CoA synthetase